MREYTARLTTGWTVDGKFVFQGFLLETKTSYTTKPNVEYRQDCINVHTFLQKFPLTQMFPHEHLVEAGQSHVHHSHFLHEHVRVRLSPVHLHLLEQLHERPSVMHRPETVRALVEEERVPDMECSMVMPMVRAMA